MRKRTSYLTRKLYANCYMTRRDRLREEKTRHNTMGTREDVERKFR